MKPLLYKLRFALENTRLGRRLDDWREFAGCFAADVLHRADGGHVPSLMLRPAARRIPKPAADHQVVGAADHQVVERQPERYEFDPIPFLSMAGRPEEIPPEIWEVAHDYEAYEAAMDAYAAEHKDTPWRSELQTWMAYLLHAQLRLNVGHAEYAGQSFDRPAIELIGELEEEAADVGGWATIAHEVLAHSEPDDGTRELADQQLLAMIAAAMRVYEHAGVLRTLLAAGKTGGEL